MRRLILGLLSPTSSGNGFDSLTFKVAEHSTDVLQDVTFTSLAQANAYFTDNPIDLGSDSGLATLEFDLSLTTTGVSHAYQASMIYGDATANSNLVPEPCGAVLMGLPAAALCLRRRKRG